MTLRVLPEHGEQGIGLVDALFAMFVSIVCTVGTAGLLLYAARLQTTAQDVSFARTVAARQVERLRVLPPAAPEKQVGGSLETDVANHFDQSSPGFSARWTVAAGPASTRDVTVAVQPTAPLSPQIRVRVLLWP